MERKNTVLLTVIAVATLLVAVVGATFAYFTATTTGGTNSGDGANVQTATADGIELDMQPVTVSNGTIYPGMLLATGVSLEATNTSGSDIYTVKFSITGEIDTSGWKGTSSQLKYSLYTSEDAVESPIKANSCQRQEDTASQSGKTLIYYENCEVDDGLTLVGSAQTITAGTDKSDIVITDNALTIDTGSSKHYYLVVEYVNKEVDENGTNDQTGTDANKSITIKITGTSGEVATKKA